jgi:hypothetical protein
MTTTNLRTVATSRRRARAGAGLALALLGALALAGCGHSKHTSHPAPSDSSVAVPIGSGPTTTSTSTSTSTPSSSSTPNTAASADGTPTEPATSTPAGQATGIDGVVLPPGILAVASPSYQALQAPSTEQASVATQVAAAMFTFTARDSGPGAWVKANKNLMTPGTYAYLASTIGDIPGSAYQYWSQVVDQNGSQSGTIVECDVDPSQAATNNANHVSLNLTVHVSHRGFTYPPGSIDPAGVNQFVDMNLTKQHGVWRVTYLAPDQSDNVPADYGRIHMTKGGPTAR